MTSRPPRLAPLPEAAWSAPVREILAGVRLRPGEPVQNIFAVLARHPDLLRSWLRFGSHVLLRSSLPARERELAILRVAWLARSDYEWGQHVRIAREVGVDQAEIERVTAGPGAPGWSEREALVLRAADEAHAHDAIGDETWAGLSHHFDEQALLDLLFTLGQYRMVALVLNSLRVPLDPGLEPLPAQAAAAPDQPGEPGHHR